MTKTKKIILPLIFLLLVASVLLFTSCGGGCKKGHTIEIDPAVEPTCESEGLTEGSHCTVCNEVITKQEKVAKLEHKEGGFVVIEGENKINSTCVSCSHVFNSYTATKLVDDWSNAWATDAITTLDLTSYALVYKPGNNDIETTVNEFSNAIFEKTGVRLTPVIAKEYKSSQYSGAIFVGDTGLVDSTNAKKILQAGYSYAVRSSKGKITIVGKTDADLTAALNFVVANYLTTYISEVSMPVCTLGTNPRDVEINISDFYLVIDHNTYDLPYHAYVGGSTSVNYDNNYDLAVSFADVLGINDKIIKDSMELPNCAYISNLDGVSYEQRTKAIDNTTTNLILFGNIDHPASVAFRENLPANCHGFKIIDEETIVVAGHNDAGLEAAMTLFRKEYFSNDEKVFKAGYTSIEVTSDKWIVDFPRPSTENIKLYNTDTSLGDTLQLLYTGSGVSDKAFDDYCAKLQKAGYELYGSVSTFGKNKAATFVNESKNSSLHVIYNAFEYQNQHSTMDSKRVQSSRLTTAESDGKRSYTVKYPLPTYDPCIRVISSPLDARVSIIGSSRPYSSDIATSIKVELPGEELLTKDYSYKKVTETSITAVGLPSVSVGTSYVIQLEDGSFIVVDGGNLDTSTERPDSNGNVGMKRPADEADILYKTLSRLHREAFEDEGTVPSTITIRAWYLTHGHYDHFNAFSAFVYQYGKGNKVSSDKATVADKNFKVDVQNVLTHIVSNSLQNISNSNTEITLAANYLSSIQYSNGGGAKYVRTHAGQVLHFANVTLEILMTPEDFNPQRITNTNDTNTIIKMRVSSKNDQQNKVSMLFTGDACIYQSRYLCATYGDYLESDMVTMGHHGNIGCETALYEEVQARILWYPHTVSAYKSYTNTSSSGWPHNVTQRLVEMECLEYVYVSGDGATWNDDVTSKSGVATVSLKFNNATPNYDAPVDVFGNTTIAYVTSRVNMNDHDKLVFKNPNYKAN